jgi:hypothetical protein
MLHPVGSDDIWKRPLKAIFVIFSLRYMNCIQTCQVVSYRSCSRFLHLSSGDKTISWFYLVGLFIAVKLSNHSTKLVRSIPPSRCHFLSFPAAMLNLELAWGALPVCGNQYWRVVASQSSVWGVTHSLSTWDLLHPPWGAHSGC